MGHGKGMAAGGRALWRWAATLALLLALLGGGVAQVARAAAPTGGVVAWGQDGDGQLGNGTPDDQSLPVRAGRIADAVAVAGGGDHSLALAADGTIWSWGMNTQGQLGDGTTNGTSTNNGFDIYRPNPGKVTGPDGTGVLGGIKAIATHGDSSLALTTDGHVYAWGDGAQGQMADGTTNSSNPVPVLATDAAGAPLANIVAIAVGSDQGFALTAGGNVLAWGEQDGGVLGNGTTTAPDCNGSCSTRARLVVGPTGTGALSGIAKIAAAGDTVLALTTGGQVYAWGDNQQQQLGQGTTASGPDISCGCSPTPVLVAGPGGVGQLGGIADLAVGGDFSLALTTGGQVYAWGQNLYGELGVGMTTGPETCLDSNESCGVYPRLVVAPSGVSGTLGGITAIAAGGESGLALAGDGSLYTWGGNSNGQLGIGTFSGPEKCQAFSNDGSYCSTFPVKVAAPGGNGTLGNVVAIAVGGGHSLAVTVAPIPAPVRYTVNAAAAPSGVVLADQGITRTTGSGTVTPSGATQYEAGAAATYTATAAAGSTFIGWTLDGKYVGYASPLTFVVNGDRTLVAQFIVTPTFSDTGALSPADRQMITFLAALGIINPGGVNGSGQFQPGADVKRAEVAAFVARTFGWQHEFHANTFPDRCVAAAPTNCIDSELWTDVAALKDYGVVGGYTDPTTCNADGFNPPCYLPRDVVKRVQVVSVVARAFTKTPDLRPTGFWDRLAPNGAQYTNVSTDGTQRSDLTTYRANAGEIPGQADSATFANPEGNGLRLFVIQVLYQAFNAQFGVDRVP